MYEFICKLSLINKIQNNYFEQVNIIKFQINNENLHKVM